jgi:hypothetical protein
MILEPLREEEQTEEVRRLGIQPSSPVSRLFLSPASHGGRPC